MQAPSVSPHDRARRRAARRTLLIALLVVGCAAADAPTRVLHSQVVEIPPSNLLDCHGGIPEGAKSEAYDTQFELAGPDVTHSACECQWNIGTLHAGWRKKRDTKLGIAITGAILTAAGAATTAALVGSIDTGATDGTEASDDSKSQKAGAQATAALTAGAGLMTALGAIVPQDSAARAAHQRAYAFWQKGVDAVGAATRCARELASRPARPVGPELPPTVAEVQDDPKGAAETIRELSSEIDKECTQNFVKAKWSESASAFGACAALSATDRDPTG